jgi:hypothetical protein
VYAVVMVIVCVMFQLIIYRDARDVGKFVDMIAEARVGDDNAAAGAVTSSPLQERVHVHGGDVTATHDTTSATDAGFEPRGGCKSPTTVTGDQDCSSSAKTPSYFTRNKPGYCGDSDHHSMAPGTVFPLCLDDVEAASISAHSASTGSNDIEDKPAVCSTRIEELDDDEDMKARHRISPSPSPSPSSMAFFISNRRVSWDPSLCKPPPSESAFVPTKSSTPDPGDEVLPFCSEHFWPELESADMSDDVENRPGGGEANTDNVSSASKSNKSFREHLQDAASFIMPRLSRTKTQVKRDLTATLASQSRTASVIQAMIPAGIANDDNTRALAHMVKASAVLPDKVVVIVTQDTLWYVLVNITEIAMTGVGIIRADQWCSLLAPQSTDVLPTIQSIFDALT